jgi:hypothetical protein
VSVSRKVIVPPAEEPVTLDRAKLHLRVDATAEDDLITAWVAAARRYAEDHANRYFVTQTVRATFDRFPPFDPVGWDFWLTPGYPSPAAVFPNPLTRAIRLPGGAIQAVIAVEYDAADGTQQTLVEGTDYLTHLDHLPPLVYPAPGKIWPVTQFGRMGCVRVTYTAGYGDAGQVPEQVGAAILLAVGYWYEHRGDTRDPSGEMGLPPGAKRLLDTLQVGVYP